MAEDVIRTELARVAAMLGAPDGMAIELETPREKSHGDVATNLALLLARPLKQAPRRIAEQIVAALRFPPGVVAGVEIAGPGFINFRLGRLPLAGTLQAILAQGAGYGRHDGGAGAPVNVEFVSANPTGPLHVGHGRQAALGDAIAALLEWTGWTVTREFYYNDGGLQIERLRDSVYYRAVDEEPPEDHYLGEYIRDIAAAFVERLAGQLGTDARGAKAHLAAAWPDDAGLREELRRFAVAALRAEQDRDLQAFGVRFDVYFLESSLYADGKVERTLDRLKAAGHTYELDGALWLRTTDFGDDKDRVLVRSEARGSLPTYFVPDVAYHVTKWERGFTRAINVQGADHHSTVTRVRVGLQALDWGLPAGYPEYVLHQMVTVTKGGAEVKISKRAGSYVTVRDLVDEVGRDAVRYFLVMRKGDTQLQFDIDLALKRTEENPVFYVQMAHARMAGIFRVGAIDPASVTLDGVDLAVLQDPVEADLIKQLARFPGVVQRAANALEPQRVTQYLEDLARAVHGWYHRCHVLGEPEPVLRARLALARAAQIVLANALTLLGLTAPDRL